MFKVLRVYHHLNWTSFDNFAFNRWHKFLVHIFFKIILLSLAIIVAHVTARPQGPIIRGIEDGIELATADLVDRAIEGAFGYGGYGGYGGGYGRHGGYGGYGGYGGGYGGYGGYDYY